MNRITVSGMAERPRCFRIDDVIYFPRPISKREMIQSIQWMKRTGQFQSIMNGYALPAISNEQAFVNLELLCFQDFSYRRRPEWLAELPLPARRHLESSFARNALDTFAIFPVSPYMGMRFMVLESGLTEDVVRTFNLFRLRRIRQLGYLTDPTSLTKERTSFGLTFSHTRYEHTLTAMALVQLMTANSHLPLRVRHTLKVAALLHDILTPAGGDTTKLADRQAFDEDANFADVLDTPAWEAFSRRCSVDVPLLLNVVQGRGPLSLLHDAADKGAYLSSDAWQYSRKMGNLVEPTSPEIEPDTIENLLTANPNIAGIWDVIKVLDRRAVITDPDRWINFIKLRTLLFQMLYWNPSSRFIEFILGSVVIKYMYRTGKLSQAGLRRMADEDLDKAICSFLGIDLPWRSEMFGQPVYEGFDALDQARARELELNKRGIVFTTIDLHPASVKLALHYPVLDSKGRIRDLEDIRPAQVQDLHRIARIYKPARLYYLPNPDLNPEVLKKLLECKLATRDPAP